MGACTWDTGGLYFLSTEHTPISLSPRCSPSQAQLLHLVKARLRPFRLPGEYQQRLCITGATERQMGHYLRGWQRCVVGDRDNEDFGLARCINLGKDMAIRHSQRDTARKHYDLTVVYVESTRVSTLWSCGMEGSVEGDRGGSILDIVASGRAVG